MQYEPGEQPSRVEQMSPEMGVSLFLIHHTEAYPASVQTQTKEEHIHFYFCVHQEVVMQFPAHGGYRKSLQKGSAFLYYNPNGSEPIAMKIPQGTQLLSLCLSVNYLHKLFIREFDGLDFLIDPQRNQIFHTETPLSPALSMVIDQVFHLQVGVRTQNLFIKAKVLEILSLYFGQQESAPSACPFLTEEAHIEKIRHAKEIIIRQMLQPPGLKTLAKEVGLNEYQLKIGFKKVYGSPVFKYLSDYKMNYARKLLDTGQLRVSEVGYQIGYSNPSHFIAAFKKRFGVTPKKYVSLEKIRK